MKRKVFITIGCPGSGKSTWTQNYVKHLSPNNYAICSADNFFIKNGVYVFDRSKLKLAHKTCQENYINALKNPQIKNIIVDNTNITKREREFYIVEAHKYNIEPQYIIAEEFQKAVDSSGIEREMWVKLFTVRNLHGVPEETIRRMIKNYEPPV